MGLLKAIFKAAFGPSINRAKGAIGEKKVASKIRSADWLGEEQRVINDLILMDERGKSHQIDHVVIRSNGVFCIETKSHAGRIYGGERDETWLQVLPGEKHRFLNPIRQNRSHIYHLNRIFEGRCKIHSVIVMARNNAENISVPYVVNLRDLPAYLSGFDDGTCYTEGEMDAIWQCILAEKSHISKREHIENIRETRRETESGICPRCGGTLKRRRGAYGEFYGCANYPSCKFTKKI